MRQGLRGFTLVELLVVLAIMAVLIGLAEEVGEGALLMVAELSRLRVNFDYAFALHNKPNKERNKILMYKNVYAAYQRFCTRHCYKCAYW